jgi:hypothetical protein
MLVHHGRVSPITCAGTIAPGSELRRPRRPAGAHLGHDPGGSRGQPRSPTDLSVWPFTCANAGTLDLARRHAVYGMQEVWDLKSPSSTTGQRHHPAPSASDASNPPRTAVARSASAVVTCSARTNRSTCGAIPQVLATFARGVTGFLTPIRR